VGRTRQRNSAAKWLFSWQRRVELSRADIDAASGGMVCLGA